MRYNIGNGLLKGTMIIILTLVFSGCAFLSPVALKKEANTVEISKNKPAKSCQYVAPIEATDSWLFVDMFTANDNLVQSAYSLIRNRAKSLNANYVQVLHYEYLQSSLFGVFEFTRMPAISAIAYHCPVK
ncbi:DUF4156 domain-containing protein [Fangia hongkongensis]|uniref:DUF4156 domain-containing protein n=1 Tax=Fangia hongkongensis TaxID=270495 RepID=UPI001F08E554|nr:DUF4156 domain-containing protein [Fangia hongkongensis]